MYKSCSELEKTILKTELNEDPDQVKAHIESFRRWLKSMPHLKCPVDDEFLLMFLRVAKFDHKVAQQRLDNFCTVRSSTRGYPEYFKFLPINDPMIKKVVKALQMIPLGKTKNGIMVLFYKTSCWDPNEIPINKFLAVIYQMFDVIISNQSSQITGIMSLFDLKDSAHNAMEIWSDSNLTKAVTKIWQDAYPIRMKGAILYQEPTLFHYIVSIMEFFMKDKHKSRLIRTKNDLNKAFEKFPGLKELMPTEYGGNSKLGINEKADEWLKEIEQFYSKPSKFSEIAVDETKRPKSTMEYMKNYAEFKGENPFRRKSGTFTKFDDVF